MNARTGIWLALAILGCGGGAEEVPVESDEESPEALAEEPAPHFSAPVDTLRRRARALDDEATAHAGTARGVAAAREAVAVARELALRDPDVDWIARARAWATEASRRPEVAGACPAALDLVRLEARDANELEAAYRAAHVASRRFARRDSACAAEAERMRRTLSPFRPSREALAALDATLEEELARPSDEESLARPTEEAALWASARAEVEEEPARLEGLFVYGQGSDADGIRVVMRFDRVVAFEHGETPPGESPRRTWLELPSVRAAEGISEQLAVHAGGLDRVRVIPRTTGLRVAFDLARHTRFEAFVLPSPFRVVLDFEASDGTDRAPGPVRRVVLDPGHGGDDFGARAFGMRESDLTLDIARRVRTRLLRSLPDVEVVLTREGDEFVSLEQRAAMANAIGADLFLSIHLNAADEEVSRGGVTTFVLDTTDDRQALRLAARENETSVAEVDGLSRILAGLHREDQLRASRAVAEHVHRETLAGGRRVLPRLHDRGVKSALFYVLVGARMPAILLEASFLSRQQEADALRTPAYRQALADGIAEGIVRWAAP